MDVTKLIKEAIDSGQDSLDLSNKDLTDLPAAIGGFTGRSVDLSGNRLATLPPEIGTLANVSRLYLRGNSDIALPAEIGKLTGLEWLDLSQTGLTAVPSWLTNLDHLVHLELSANQIAVLPPDFGRLTKLQRLFIDGNQLSTLPSEMRDLIELSALDISGNLLTEFPEFLTELPNLYYLTAADNPLVTPPTQVVDEGIEAIRAYYRQAAKEGFDYLYEAKLIIVGEPNAGKTTLSKKIVNAKYQSDHEESTHGIRIDRWQFTHESGRPFYANIWDFGGQEIYHATHRFFLTESSCYVLVAQERREDNDFNYWLQIVQLLGRDSPLIILRNVVDKRVKEIPEKDLRGKFPCFKDTITIDVKHDGGRFDSDVVRPIKFYLSGLKHIGDPLPKPWTLVRKALEENTHDYISYEEFETICRNNRFTEDVDIANLCRYFHNIGVCLHYADDPLLRRKVILKPEWGTRVVYSILKSDKVVQYNGRFQPEDVHEVLDKPEDRRMCDEIIELMAKFELSYRVPNSNTYISPQLLPLDKPSYTWDESDNRMLRYTFPDFMPKGMLWRFVVAMHEYIEGHNLVWRGGVVLLADDTRAEVVEEYPKEIRIRASGPRKRDLITRVDHEFRKVYASYNSLPYNAEIACNCKVCIESATPRYFLYDDLRRANSARKPVTCMASFLDVNPQRLIDDVLDETRQDSRLGDLRGRSGSLVIEYVENLTIDKHTEGSKHMGDQNFTAGPGSVQAGIITHSSIAIQQTWNEIGHDIDLDKLAEQLTAVRSGIKKLPESDDNDEAVGKLVEAKKAAEKKDGPKALEWLKSAGPVALEVAKSMGADVIVKLLESAFGMPSA